MLTHLRETFNHLRMHLFIYLFIKNVCITGEGPLGSFGGGKQGVSWAVCKGHSQTNDKMSLCLIHCGPRCHPGCCSPLWESRVKFARRQAGFCKPFVGPAHCWTVQADLWWDLILSKGVSYSAQRDRAICFAKGGTDSQSQRRHSSCWLLTLLVTKLCSSMLSLKLTLGGAQAATVTPPPSFSQVTLVCSSQDN